MSHSLPETPPKEELVTETMSALELPPLANGKGEGQGAQIDDKLVKNKVMAALFGMKSQAARIGRYTLLDRIGAGGMGEIYAAYDDKLDRKIAIKLVRTGSDKSGLKAQRRLQREAQVLARLSHPNVVHVYETGVAYGQVFIAMEFIRGVSLSTWLADHRASPRAHWRPVLELLLAAGRGLEAAHQAGLIHRDFKPDNVLIGEDGRPRVIDFGLARQVVTPAAESGDDVTASRPDAGAPEPDAPETRADTPLTAAGTLMGTPAYMSPEQVTGDVVEHRSDQFSFCVTAYEALFGLRPFAGASIHSRAQAVHRGEITPPPAGTNVPAWIRRALVRGLAADPAQRYPSMSELLLALSRDPARMRRRWLAGALLIAVGVASGGAAALGVRPAAPAAIDVCASAAHDLEPIWNAAVKGQMRQAFASTGAPYAGASWQNVEMLVDRYAEIWRRERMDACTDGHIHRTHSEAVTELRSFCLDRRVRRLRGLLASFAHADRETVRRAVEAVAALPDPTECSDGEALRLGIVPPERADAAAVAVIRDRLAEAHAAEYTGHYDKGIAIADEQVEAAGALGYTPVHAEALYGAGRLRLLRAVKRDIEPGREMLLQAADLAEASRHDELAADTWSTLAHLLRNQSYDAALQPMATRRALAAVERLGDQGMRRAAALRNQGGIHYVEKRYREAEEFQRQALAMAERAHRSEVELIPYWRDLANTLEALAEVEEAKRIYERALRVAEAELGPSHPSVVFLSMDYATFLIQAGELERAGELLHRVLAARSILFGEDSFEVARVHRALANLAVMRLDLKEAESRAERSLVLYRRHLGDTHPDVADVLGVLGAAYYYQRRYAKAVDTFHEARALQVAGLGSEDLLVGFTESNLGESLVMLGRHDEALRSFAAAERIFAASGTEHPVFLALPQKGRGLMYLAQGKAKAAVAPLEAALALLRKHPGYPLELASTAWALARALRESSHNSHERARALAEEARAIYVGYGQAMASEVDAIRAWLAP